jgi:hypothetical protein
MNDAPLSQPSAPADPRDLAILRLGRFVDARDAFRSACPEAAIMVSQAKLERALIEFWRVYGRP